MEDALCRSMWSVGVKQIAAGLRWISPPSRVGDTTIFYTLVSPSVMTTEDGTVTNEKAKCVTIGRKDGLRASDGFSFLQTLPS